jgi:hypothetical protein
LLVLLLGSSAVWYRAFQIDSCVEDNVYVLTFDDGPSPVTGKLLKTLMDVGVRASFFLVGQNVRDLSSLVRRSRLPCSALHILTSRSTVRALSGQVGGAASTQHVRPLVEPRVAAQPLSAGCMGGDRVHDA